MIVYTRESCGPLTNPLSVEKVLLGDLQHKLSNRPSLAKPALF